MSRSGVPGSRASVLVVVALSAAACVIKSVKVSEVPRAVARRVTSPVKLHLIDGSTVVYADGITVTEASVQGSGERYNIALRAVGPYVTSVPMDSIAAMETYRAVVRPAETVMLSTLGTAATVAAGAALAVAIFGSCPTVYADSAGVPVLEAESFSYSIAPLFEMRDVDRLRVRASEGVVTLEIRNEALETHYINHLELLQVAHRPDARVIPDATGKPLAVQGLTPPIAARDRAGHDWRAELAAPDGVVFRSDSALLAAATAADLEDWLDLTLPAPSGADSVALVLRLQNSLLTTVLFYDVMLGELGYRAADWMAHDLERIGAAVELGQWGREQLGVRVEIFDGATYRPVGQLSAVGPLAAKDVALVLPTLGADTVRLRLRFAVDNWRIDHVALASAWLRAAPRAIPLARVTNIEGRDDASALAAAAAPDESYLVTRAGQRLFAQFDVGPEPAGGARTFLLASQGYYVEWVRQAWLRTAPRAERFTPGPESLHRAIVRWRDGRESRERAFYASRIPVR